MAHTKELETHHTEEARFAMLRGHVGFGILAGFVAFVIFQIFFGNANTMTTPLYIVGLLAAVAIGMSWAALKKPHAAANLTKAQIDEILTEVLKDYPNRAAVAQAISDGLSKHTHPSPTNMATKADIEQAQNWARERFVRKTGK